MHPEEEEFQESEFYWLYKKRTVNATNLISVSYNLRMVYHIDIVLRIIFLREGDIGTEGEFMCYDLIWLPARKLSDFETENPLYVEVSLW